MKFKLDENLDPGLVPWLAAGVHDVATVRDEGLSGAPDETIFQAVQAEDRTLVTLDLDFSNPVRFPTAGTAGVIVVRVPRPILKLIEATLKAAIPIIHSDQIRGRLWIVEPGRIREYTPAQTD